MLILGRKTGESICIGNDVTVTVVESKSGHVKLGVTAPEQIRVDRKEIKELRDAGVRQHQ